MRVLWRISNRSELEGLGGERADGRWHTAARGKRIVYLSEHPALALLEVLANLKGNPELFPDAYQLLKIAVADAVSAAWHSAGSTDTQSAGDSWLADGTSALLAVPSFPAPESTNYLLNPLHPDASGVTIEWRKWLSYDKRLFHLRAS